MTDIAKQEEIDLIEKKMWSSKQLWSALTAVAFAVFILTMIYAKFLGMEKDIVFMKEQNAVEIASMKETHSAEIVVLTNRIKTQDARWNANIEELEDEVDINAATIVLLKLDAHEPGPGQKRIHR